MTIEAPASGQEVGAFGLILVLPSSPFPNRESGAVAPGSALAPGLGPHLTANISAYAPCGSTFAGIAPGPPETCPGFRNLT